MPRLAYQASYSVKQLSRILKSFQHNFWQRLSRLTHFREWLCSFVEQRAKGAAQVRIVSSTHKVSCESKSWGTLSIKTSSSRKEGAIVSASLNMKLVTGSSREGARISIDDSWDEGMGSSAGLTSFSGLTEFPLARRTSLARSPVRTL